MAMTGGTAYLVKSEYTNSGQNNWTTDLYIYVKIVSQNPAANTSTIALGMYVYSKYNIDWGDWSNGGQSYVGTATSGSNCFTFTDDKSIKKITDWFRIKGSAGPASNNQGISFSSVFCKGLQLPQLQHSQNVKIVHFKGNIEAHNVKAVNLALCFHGH